MPTRPALRDACPMEAQQKAPFLRDAGPAQGAGPAGAAHAWGAWAPGPEERCPRGAVRSWGGGGP
ncbi:hypothetical protein GCM10010363_37160 [Streptomyces omiyaensis]|nr:hypothetical protein GCM10010363_37160 [Streptomyces omiyaensis]